MSEWLHVEIIEPGKAQIWYGDGDLCAVVYDNLGLDVNSARLAALFAASPALLAACKMLCKAIKTMGQLAVLREFDETDGDGDIDPQYIEDNWLDYVPQCEADAYRAGQVAIAAAEKL